MLSASAALFVDFDGTLVPIAPRPQDVRVPAWVLPALDALAQWLGGAIAIVSGRPIEQLDAFLAPLRLPTAGAHGAEWRGAAGRIERHEAEPPAGVVECAAALAGRHAGLILEPKPSGLSLHYRARPELESTCRDALVAAPLDTRRCFSSKTQWPRNHSQVASAPGTAASAATSASRQVDSSSGRAR